MSDALMELEGLQPQIANALQTRRLGNSVDRANARLADAPKQASRFKALVEAAVALGAASDVSARHSLREAVQEAEDIGEGLETAKTAEDLQYVSEDFPKLAAALRTLDNVVRQLWRQTVANEFQSLTAVGRLLTHIAAAADLGQRLMQIGQEAQELVERNAPAEELAPKIAQLRQARTALDDELHRLTHHPEVDAFLAAVTRDAATLSHVTPAVFDWLRGSHALEAFAVRGQA